MNLLESLSKKGLIKDCPAFLPLNVHYLTQMGSTAYGVSDDQSDVDLYGFCIPPREMIFPHLAGEIPGFGRQHPRFEQYQRHHIVDPSAAAGRGQEYDITVYSIVKYFQLCMENNPNMIDSLFTPITMVQHCTHIGSLVRDNRKLFLHKGAWHKFKGYAYSQIHKMRIKDPKEGARRDLVERFGYDVKFAYHVVRLLDEAEQILTEGDIDLQRNREQLKSIRRGEWTLEEIIEHFSRKEKELDSAYTASTLRHSPDEASIKRLLLNCMEEHYGSLADAVAQPDAALQALDAIQEILNGVRQTIRLAEDAQ